MRKLLENKLQGKAVLFHQDHLEALCQKGLNTSELMDAVSWKQLRDEPAPLPEALIVVLLQAFHPASLSELGKAPTGSPSLSTNCRSCSGNSRNFTITALHVFIEI